MIDDSLDHPRYLRSNRYDPHWVMTNQMGPNALWLIESSTEVLNISAGCNRHASGHHREVGHPIVQSYEPGEDWWWCFDDEVAFTVPDGPNFSNRWPPPHASSSPAGQPRSLSRLRIEMLSVQVPDPVAIWLLGDGRAQVTELLEHVPVNVDIWDATDDHFAVLEQLWDVLDTAYWPDPKAGNGLGPTTKSKLISAKRPRMAPIIDSVVREAFGSPPSMWDGYRYAFSEPEYRLMELIATQDRGDMSVLRAVDAIVWMAHAHPLDGDPDIDEAIREIKERNS